jgi:hypothetical protein
MNTVDDTPPFSRAEQLAQLVRDLRRRADSATQAHQVEDVSTVAGDFVKIKDEAVLAADVSVAREMLDIAGVLISIGQRNLVEPVFQKAVRILSSHPHATVRDRFLSLNNLAAFYDSEGDSRSRDEILSTLLTFASELTDLIDSKTSVAFFELAQLYDRAGHARLPCSSVHATSSRKSTREIV